MAATLEVVTVMLVLASTICPPITWWDVIKAVLMLAGAAAILGVLFWRAANGSEPIRMLLQCSRSDAKEIHAIMRKKGISWLRFHANCCGAMGYFLPLYGRVVDDRPVADSGETRQAIVFAMLRGSIKAGMRKDEFIQVIAKELVHFRDTNSSLTDPTRQVDGIMF